MSLNETPIQRLQREVAELRVIFRASLELTHEAHEARFAAIDSRLDGQAAALRALATSPGEVAEAMTKRLLRSVDDE